MNLELRSQRVNGAGELIGTVAVMDASGVLLFEDSLNLSKARQREALVQEIAQRAKVTSEQARKELLRLMQAHRAALLQEAKEEAPKRVRKADQLVNALLKKGPLLFADQYGEPHIALPEDTRRAVFRVRSSAFRDRLANLGYVEMGEGACLKKTGSHGESRTSTIGAALAKELDDATSPGES